MKATERSYDRSFMHSVGQTRAGWLTAKIEEVKSTDTCWRFAATVVFTYDNRKFGFERSNDATDFTKKSPFVRAVCSPLRVARFE